MSERRMRQILRYLIPLNPCLHELATGGKVDSPRRRQKTKTKKSVRLRSITRKGASHSTMVSTVARKSRVDSRWHHDPWIQICTEPTVTFIK